MNNFFYRPFAEDDYNYSNDPRGYISPYLDAYMESETENRVLMTRYMNLKNQTNHIFKIRCNDQAHGRL